MNTSLNVYLKCLLYCFYWFVPNKIYFLEKGLWLGFFFLSHVKFPSLFFLSHVKLPSLVFMVWCHIYREHYMLNGSVLLKTIPCYLCQIFSCCFVGSLSRGHLFHISPYQSMRPLYFQYLDVLWNKQLSYWKAMWAAVVTWLPSSINFHSSPDSVVRAIAITWCPSSLTFHIFIFLRTIMKRI